MGRTDGRPERPYIMVDRELIELLEPDELALYVVLLSYLRSPERMTDRQCWPSEQELARSYGRSHDVVRRVMSRLVTRGLVTKTRRGKTRSNLYQLAQSIPGAPASDDAETRNHFQGDYADPRTRDDADPRNEVQEEKEKNYPPGSSSASLSPSVPRAPAHTEREQLIIRLTHEHSISADRLIRLAQEHGATIEELEAGWHMASNPDFPGAEEYRSSFRDWFKAWIKDPGEVAQDIANYRDKLRCDAEHEERQRLAARPRPECAVCRRPFARQPPGRDIPPGAICTECAA
jgi:hypothetical protein